MIARALLIIAALCFAPAVTSAQINMPDPSQIHGRALPAPELPDGTITVRVVRESIGNNIVAQAVQVKAGADVRTAATDESGRAQFAGLRAGASAVAEATVDGEALVSQPFVVPETGGLRVILVAGLAQAEERRQKESAAAAAAPPVKGVVTFGGNSRVVMEFQDDALQVFYVLEVVNTARSRVDPGGPLILDLPTGAAGATVLEGSAPGAVARGDRITIMGPFASGSTMYQIGYRLPIASSSLVLEQRWPAALERLNVVIEKAGAVHMASPQFTQHGDVRANDGAPYIMGTGNGIPAGGALAVTLSGLPVHPAWPRQVALSLALAVVGVGAWLAASGGRREEEKRRRLSERREAMFAELVKLEAGLRAGRIDEARYQGRRQQIISDLERIYGELDETGTRGGDEGLAA